VAVSSDIFPWNAATGTNISEEMWNEYLKVTEYLKIPTKNIENVYFELINFN
jgi:dimeric dUTPase (all-alpha-NTP-PPase superfamily)